MNDKTNNIREKYGTQKKDKGKSKKRRLKNFNLFLSSSTFDLYCKKKRIEFRLFHMINK
jgi:hypothetical protein